MKTKLGQPLRRTGGKIRDDAAWFPPTSPMHEERLAIGRFLLTIYGKKWTLLELALHLQGAVVVDLGDERVAARRRLALGHAQQVGLERIRVVVPLDLFDGTGVASHLLRRHVVQVAGWRRGNLFLKMMTREVM